jgi:hypothetical protein
LKNLLLPQNKIFAMFEIILSVIVIAAGVSAYIAAKYDGANQGTIDKIL